jgi:hypothetical protein
MVRLSPLGEDDYLKQNRIGAAVRFQHRPTACEAKRVI